MARQCRLEVLARLGPPARACRGASEDALQAAGGAAEAPLDQPVRIRGELAVQARTTVGIAELSRSFAERTGGREPQHGALHRAFPCIVVGRSCSRSVAGVEVSERQDAAPHGRVSLAL